jgi:hypothetical protein
MSDFQEFIQSRVLRHPTTWIVGLLGAAYGGLAMYGIREAHRAAGTEPQFTWLWLERSVDFLVGAAGQVVFLLCAVWMIAGLLERGNVWIRQVTVVVLYLGLNWLSQYL